jgi:hypothetical protein
MHSSFTLHEASKKIPALKPLLVLTFSFLNPVEKLTPTQKRFKSGKKCYFVLKQAIFPQTTENDRLFR